MKSGIVLAVMLASCWMAESALAEDQVVTIYFAGTNNNSEDWRESESGFDQPETVATLHHFQIEDSTHHKGFVNGFVVVPIWGVDVNNAIEILDRVPPCAGQCITLNLVGFSRGGISTMLTAKWVLDGLQLGPLETGPWSRRDQIKKLNILAFDPVPGDPALYSRSFNLPSNVEFLGFYALDERSAGFSPLFPAGPSNPRIRFFKVPGSHETLVGSIYKNGHRDYHGDVEALRNVSRTLRTIATEILGSSDWGHVRFVPDPDPNLNLDWYDGETGIDQLRERFQDQLGLIYESGIDYAFMREYSHVQVLGADIRASWHYHGLGDWECRNAPVPDWARDFDRCVYYYPNGYSSDYFHMLGEGNAPIGDATQAEPLNEKVGEAYVIWNLIEEQGSLDVDGDLVDYHDDNCGVTANPDQADSDGDGTGDACDITADAGLDQIVECTSPAGAFVTLDGSACEGDIQTFDWFEGPLALGSGEILDTLLALGTHTIDLRVTGRQGETDEDETMVAVQDTTPPVGAIVFPAPGQCFGPGALPVDVTDDFSDVCDPALTRSYAPAGGPSYAEHGDTEVQLTVMDASANDALASVAFSIDKAPPVVRIFQPVAGTLLSPSTLPLSVVFAASDDDGASGGVVHESINLQGCTILDGMTYGDADGLLSDETVRIDQGALCAVFRQCGFTTLNQPELRVDASDCGENVGSASVVFRGSLALIPGLCGR